MWLKPEMQILEGLWRRPKGSRTQMLFEEAILVNNNCPRGSNGGSRWDSDKRSCKAIDVHYALMIVAKRQRQETNHSENHAYALKTRRIMIIVAKGHELEPKKGHGE